MDSSHGMTRTAVLAVAFVCALLAFAQPAAAQSCKAPPGQGAVDEYCEDIPAADGDHGPSDGAGQGQVPGRSGRGLGRDRNGPPLYFFTQGTGQARTHGAAPSSNHPGDSSALGSSLVPSSWLGTPLFWVLLAITGGLGAAGVYRWRRGRAGREASAEATAEATA